jgi:hypothetical protein
VYGHRSSARDGAKTSAVSDAAAVIIPDIRGHPGAARSVLPKAFA